jgi:transposase
VLSYEDWFISSTLCLHRPTTPRRTDVLGVGIDWAEQAHAVALGSPEQGVFETSTVPHTPAAVDQLIARIGALEPDPAEVRVVLETRHGLLVEALVDAGFTVVPVNPDLIARRRGPAKKKDDPEDARIACLLALDRFTTLKPLIPHGQVATELRAIARDDARAAKDERRLLNRLRADLLATFPVALDIAGDDLGAPTFLKLLETWPTAQHLAETSRDELEAFARSCRHGWPARFADKIVAALAHDHFVARDPLVRAKTDTIRLYATQLLAIGRQRRAWEKRMGQLLIGPGDDPLGEVFPDGEIYLSMPGLGARLAARVAGEIGDHPGQFDTPNGLQCYGGKAPVTRRSGSSEYLVARRLACNRYLDAAVQDWAFCSLRWSGWARDYYDAQRARGKSHHAALRALGNRWLNILWHCLNRGVLYDETLHQTNRQRAREQLAA